jgi:hypothetical protein
MQGNDVPCAIGNTDCSLCNCSAGVVCCPLRWDYFTLVPRTGLQAAEPILALRRSPGPKIGYPPSLSSQPKSHAPLRRTTLGYPDFLVLQ